MDLSVKSTILVKHNNNTEALQNRKSPQNSKLQKKKKKKKKKESVANYHTQKHTSLPSHSLDSVQLPETTAGWSRIKVSK